MQWWVERVLNDVNAYQQGAGIVAVLGWVVWVLGSISLHELGHGWAALRQGDSTPREMDRMNFNPYVHMGPISLLVFAVIGIAWGVMPVRPWNFREGKLGVIKVSLAGPAVNAILALIAIVGMVIGMAMHSMGNVAGYIVLFFFIGAYLNVVLFIFNLIPLPPLDGSTVLRSLVPSVDRFYNHPNAGFIGLAVLFIGVQFFGQYLWVLPMMGIIEVADLASSTLGAPAIEAISPGLKGF